MEGKEITTGHDRKRGSFYCLRKSFHVLNTPGYALYEVSLCMGISDNIKVMTIAVDETIKFDKVS